MRSSNNTPDPLAMKGTSTVFLAVLATALVAVANASHSDIAALLRRESGSDLHARTGVNPSSISTQCQPDCTSIINKLDVRRRFSSSLRSSL